MIRIVIVYFNNYEIFENNIKYLIATYRDISITILDNSNTLDIMILKKISKKIVIIKRTKISLMENLEKFKNYFTKIKSGAVNHAYGIKLLQTYIKKNYNSNDYIVLLDPDFIILDKNWINFCLKEMKSKVMIATEWGSNKCRKHIRSISPHFVFTRAKNFITLDFSCNFPMRYMTKFLSKYLNYKFRPLAYDPGYKIKFKPEYTKISALQKQQNYIKNITNKDNFINRISFNKMLNYIYYLENKIFNLENNNNILINSHYLNKILYENCDIYILDNNLFAIHQRSTQNLHNLGLRKSLIKLIVTCMRS
jgi:hypothetical protein